MKERRRKLKVFAVNTFVLHGKQARTIACVTSQKEFASLLGVTLGYVRTYGSETGNAEELQIAKSEIGAIFVQCPTCKHYHKWERES